MRRVMLALTLVAVFFILALASESTVGPLPAVRPAPEPPAAEPLQFEFLARVP